MKNISGMLLLGCSALALAGCGADDISSPGAGSIDVDITNPTPTPTPTPTSGLVEAAADCPAISGGTQLSNDGTISGAEGTWRVCTLPSLIEASTTLPKEDGVLYRIAGRVDVGCDGGFSAPTAASPFATTTLSCNNRSLTADTNVTLTIEPGVIIYGQNGAEPAWLAVNRGNKINAVGTATQPIIFTSYENVRGQNDDTAQGQWGGVVLMGRGKVTDCTAGGAPATSPTGNSTCERDTEGSANPAVFGGNDNTYNAGTMRYFQIRYSGYVLGSDSELQALTGEGLGTGTTLDHFQSVNSSDDGSEFFGGAVNFKHYIAVNADDDSVDTDTGFQGVFQYMLLLQRDADGDALMEIDSNGFETHFPRQKTIFANFTGVQPNQNSNSDQAAVLIRGNSDITWVNGVINVPNNECLRLHGTGTTPATITAYSTVMTCSATDGAFIGSGAYTTAQVQSAFNAGSNNNATFTSTLSSTFVNGTNEAGVVAYADMASLSSFLDQVDYIGAVKDASDTWFRGWTCDNATADFGSGSLCTALPVT
ncbi:hypothetical protein I5E68_04665 [Novosphingobium sp. YJ-S2-02]|uniref:Lipoprotein n=1 Tax=Novosphingobium aureum TaxID=2792964 RepID=A0A931HAA3_9SPHN|nr:hypothetical protein [Novosphingobium aureum]MBH0112246.1 hypothetical protein [Novosphingobium aureum]